MLFLGNIEAKIDMKGRAFLPAPFRKTLQAHGDDSLVLRPDVYQSCLALYPKSVWSEHLASLKARLNKWNPQHQLILRKFMEDVEEVNLDASGRLLIPKKKLEEVALHNVNIQILYRKILEESLILSQVHADLVRFETAQDRYKKLCKLNPQVVLRAPLVFVANYLQMTPETLSRVRATTLLD